ncbi:MAG: hypothetical protein ACXVCM_07275 [Ktedonobacteraceae bacterium]
MQTNPYEDEKPLSWVPQENLFSERESDKVHNSQQPASLHYQEWPQNMQNTRPKLQERMPKTQVLELVNVYKKRLIVASLVAFGLVSGLVAFHQVGTAATQNQVSPSQPVPVSQPSNSGGFFDQQGGNNFGSGGFGQQPSSGSGVS